MKPPMLSFGIAASLFLFGMTSSSTAQHSTSSAHLTNAAMTSRPLANASVESSTTLTRNASYDISQSRFEKNAQELEEALKGHTQFAGPHVNLDSACQRLVAGSTFSCVATVTERPTAEKPHLLARSIDLQITFERRPVGGILNIRVSLMPLFNGLGSANRPLASKNYSQALDNLDADALAGVIEGIGDQTVEVMAVRSN